METMDFIVGIIAWVIILSAIIASIAQDINNTINKDK